MDILRSSVDKSVNYIHPKPVGVMESRFVQRVDDYFMLYVSSQTGCDQACRMCHLTATGQTKFTNVAVHEFISQAIPVLDHYKTQSPARKIHVNFMARGEPLNNTVVSGESGLFERLFELIQAYDSIHVRFNISTIMPKFAQDWKLVDRFSGHFQPSIYYSMYSTSQAFRKKWLGKSMDYQAALTQLMEYQDRYPHTNNKIHFAYIDGENDSEEDVHNMIEALTCLKKGIKINIVRYNPYSAAYGVESSESVIMRNVQLLREHFGDDQVKIIPRVGVDVAASCGMFIK